MLVSILQVFIQIQCRSSDLHGLVLNMFWLTFCIHDYLMLHLSLFVRLWGSLEVYCDLRLKIVQEWIRVVRVMVVACISNAYIELAWIIPDSFYPKVTCSFKVVGLSTRLSQIDSDVSLSVDLVNLWIVISKLVDIRSCVDRWEGLTHLEKFSELLSVTCCICIDGTLLSDQYWRAWLSHACSSLLGR